MNYPYAEGNLALILSVCYGLRAETAQRICKYAEDVRQKKYIVESELNAFFDENYNRNVEMAVKKAQGIGTDALSKEYNLSKKGVLQGIEKCRIFYAEFDGLIRLNLLQFSDSEQLFNFFCRYGKFYQQEKEKQNKEYALYLRYKKGEIRLKDFRELTHKTPKAFENL